MGIIGVNADFKLYAPGPSYEFERGETEMGNGALHPICGSQECDPSRLTAESDLKVLSPRSTTANLGCSLSTPRSHYERDAKLG